MVTNRIRCKSSASQIYMFIDIALYLTLAEVTKNSTQFANTSVAPETLLNSGDGGFFMFVFQYTTGLLQIITVWF